LYAREKSDYYRQYPTGNLCERRNLLLPPVNKTNRDSRDANQLNYFSNGFCLKNDVILVKVIFIFIPIIL